MRNQISMIQESLGLRNHMSMIQDGVREKSKWWKKLNKKWLLPGRSLEMGASW